MLDVFEDVSLGLGVSRVLLVADNGGLLEDLHGVYLILIFARQLAHLEHFAVAAFAQHFAKLKV